MEFENRENVSEHEYLEMIKGKTSVLLACALQMGAWIADASVINQKLIYNFGLHLGLSFQIKDDYLDAFGEAKKTGKIIGGDILLNKKTLLLIKTEELSDSKQKSSLNKLKFEKDKIKKINGVKKLMEDTGAKKYVEDMIKIYYEKSITNMQAIKVSKNNKVQILEMASYLNKRDK
jgi:geranylgeranyl diphosphate synthase type II